MKRMNNTLEIGCYNVSFYGSSYDNDVKYEMVIIEKFNGEKYIDRSKKIFYFLDSKESVIPKMDTVNQIERFYNRYMHNSKIKCEYTIKATVII